MGRGLKIPPNNNIGQQNAICNEIDVGSAPAIGIVSNNLDESIKGTVEVHKHIKKRSKKKKVLDTISTDAWLALEQGGGRACVASHEGGCRHFGIMDLKPMHKTNYSFYIQEGQWLNGKQCGDCLVGSDSVTMEKGSGIMVYYCEMGLGARKYNKEGDLGDKSRYLDHECLLVLCTKCWHNRVEAYETIVNKNLGNKLTCASSRKRH